MADIIVSPGGQEVRFLLIARERLRSGSEDAYSENEIQIATACAALNGPHPYLALVSLLDPAEVWWVNAFASDEERDRLGELYARNESLMAKLGPLGKRKENFRETFTTTALARRPDVEDCASLQIAGARYFIVSTVKDVQTIVPAAIFDAPGGESFTIATETNCADADEAARRFVPAATILTVRPEWSFPDETWARADPDFWSSSPAAQIRRWT